MLSLHSTDIADIAKDQKWHWIKIYKKRVEKEKDYLLKAKIC